MSTAREIVAYGNVRDGKINLLDREKFIKAAGGFNDAEISLTLKVLGNPRSKPQQRYYMGVVVPIIRGLINESQGENFSNEEIHEWLKMRFNAKLIVTHNGHSLTIAQSTSKLNSAEFADYIDAIKRFAFSFFGVKIPDAVKISNTKNEFKP